MELSVGVLIIGSLYWREGSRARWRRKRLWMEREWCVRAPIRYGRLSDSGTYTMIFAPLSNDQLGRAKVVQCQRAITCLSDLIVEAEWLWSAEHNSVPRGCCPIPDHAISATWGCVALLRNPSRDIPQEILDGWAQRVAKDKASEGKHLVDGRGILQIQWPDVADDTGPVQLDLLLATSNNPKPQKGPYPSVEAIAAAWRAKGDDYFRNNRAHGIHTFQDQEIEGRLRQEIT